MVKRILSIFVLTIFLAHFAGFYIYFIIQLNSNRQEMRARLQKLPAEQLELIVLTKEKFDEAKEGEHEVEVDGKMYDIARVEDRDGRILVYCLHDEAEDNILAFLDKVLTSPLNDEHATASLIQFFSLSYIPVAWDFLIPEFFKDRSCTVYSDTKSSLCKKEISPPPKI